MITRHPEGKKGSFFPEKLVDMVDLVDQKNGTLLIDNYTVFSSCKAQFLPLYID